MQKRVLGFVLLLAGLAGMSFSVYLFVTGTGGRSHLVEVIAYLMAGASSFFLGINYLYESANTFTADQLKVTQELEEISPIQQQWRTIHIAKQPAAVTPVSTTKLSASPSASVKLTAEAV